MEGIREIGTVFSAEVRRAFKSGRVWVLLALYGMFSVLVLFVVGSIANTIRAQAEAKIAAAGGDISQATELAAEAKKSALGFFFSGDDAMQEAMKQIPLVVLIVFSVAIFFLPAYIALMGFDQTSGEVGNRAIRYLTVRARRSSVLFGKFLSQAAVLVGLALVVDLGIFLYARLNNPDFGTGVMAITLLKFWTASIVFSLAYLSLTACCSALFRSPPLSLVFNFFMLFLSWFADFLGSRFVTRVPGLVDEGPKEIQSPLAYIRYLSPSHYSTDLLHPQFSHFGVSGAAYAAFTVIFLGAAWAILRVRDL